MSEVPDCVAVASDEVVMGEPGLKPTALTAGLLESLSAVWSDGRGVDVGYWECGVGRFSAVRDGYAEICQILSGLGEVYTAGVAEPVTLRPGTTLIMPEGWRGEWVVSEAIRKVYVIVREMSV